MVPGEGFEPSVEDPKSSALPLGHPGARINTTAEGGDVRSAPRARPARSGGVTSERPVALGLVMRNVLLAALVLVTAACGAYHFPGSSPAGTGTVSGSVVAIPCTPVEAAGQQCAGRPVPGLEIDYVNGEATAKTVTDSNGNYTVQLAAGTWLVHFNGRMRIISGPQQVTVSAGSTVTANYVLDSGIRVPIPPQLPPS
jgi:hypothetical protein